MMKLFRIALLWKAELGGRVSQNAFECSLHS
jgi:hypothetical protein